MKRLLVVLGSVTVCVLAAVHGTRTSAAPENIAIEVLSTRPEYVTGGDVLVRVRGTADRKGPPNGDDGEPGSGDDTVPRSYRVVAAGKDVTAAFKDGVGLISGLPPGTSTITAETTSGTRAKASLNLTNYPITGPVFSGPWIQPFICQTDAFVLPDGSKLGPPTDANCSARTVVQHVYRTTGDTPVFKPLSTAGAYVLPSDVAKTTTTDGVTVNFIVRIETGTMNRGIYQNLILHDPTVDPAPSPATPPRGWNRRLAALHGVGCPTGWYLQGAAMGVSPLDPVRLGEGYGIFINTLNHPTTNCNAVVAGETTMMGKERFIETFGVPEYTISSGNSGGAYTSLQIADAFPGLFDGLLIGATFPDALSIALAGLDGRLLMRYCTMTAPEVLTEPQMVAVSGYHSMKAFLDAANQAQRTDPVPGRADLPGYQSARWNDAVPQAMRYDPVKNPRGARPTVFDAGRNIYGLNPSTGAALRPFDNVGVQYGLNALNAGVITPAQFLDLNERIGGFDDDANPVARRTTGDAGAIRRTYQSGLMLGGGGGLASIPIVDNAASNETAAYHYGWFHWAVRERLRQANGSSDNFVMWRGTAARDAAALFHVLDEWMRAYSADRSADPRRAKVLRARPKRAVSGCLDSSAPPALIPEDLLFSAKPASKCSALYPVYSNVRVEAGGPVAANILKCQLAPVEARSYKVAFSAADVERAKRIFPEGVCDWSKPGVNQTKVVTWASWGPAPRNPK